MAASGGGVLPGDFPAGLPVYHPAAITDFGAAGAGRRYVTLASPDSAATVRAAVRRQLERAGWEVASAAGDGGLLVLRRGGARVELTITGGAGTELRYEYPSPGAAGSGGA